MRSDQYKRLTSLLLTFALLLQLPITALAAAPTEDASPAVRYYIQNESWHYAEEMPLYNAVDAVFYLDAQSADKVVLPTVVDEGAAANRGILSQFTPSGANAKGDKLSYRSAPLFANYQNDLVGYPTANLHVNAAQAGTVTVSLEAVDAEGAVTVIGQGTATVAAGEQKLTNIALKRAYDDGQGEQSEFVAYRMPRNSSLRVSIASAAGQITLIQDADSKVTLPFVDHDENGYTGQVSVGGKTSPATLYWLPNNIYVNYAGTWLSVPADSSYTVTAEGAAKFDGFTFLPEGNAFKDAAEQSYTGGNVYTQPFPSHRHVVLATVPIESAADYLYLPTTKTLKYDIFKPTTGPQADLPLIFYIHGYSGSYSALPDFLVEMLGAGYAVAGIDLRNYPANYSPDYYHDIKGNIRDVRAKADTYGADPERFGIYGVSLGGNTALMMAVSAGNEYMEGTVGDNVGVSSRLQAAIGGYAWSDAINFGADQRTDNANDTELLASMISGGDGENAPCAQAIGFSGPGKGYLSLRLYKQAREAAKAANTLEEFLESPYSFTIDDGYIATWFPVLGANAFTGAAPTVTRGDYTFTHEYMQEKLTYAEAASPLYYVSPDDPSIMVFGGYGGRQNITNTQSTRTLKRLAEMGVPAVMAGNTMGNYGNEAEIKASMSAYLDETLMNRPEGTRIALTVGAANAVVDDLDVAAAKALVQQNGEPMIALDFVAKQMGISYDKEAEGVSEIDGADYGTVEYVKTLTGATVTVYTGKTYTANTEEVPYTTVTIVKSAPTTGNAPSAKVDAEKVSIPGVYEGYTDESDVYEQTVTKSIYVEVPATYPDQVDFPSDPDYKGDPSYNAENGTIQLAVTYMLPSEDGEAVAEGQYPAVLEISRGGRAATDSQFDAEYLVKHGYVWAMVEMRGCGASFGVNNSFASLENRLDVKYIIENWLIGQDWYNGGVAMEGGSNRGLIQWATATTDPDELKAISPIVCNADFYYQDYRNGASCVPSGRPLSGTGGDTVAKTYDEWIDEPKMTFVDDDADGKKAYEAYAYYTTRNMPFTAYLLRPNLNRDEPNESLYGEKVNLTIPPVEYSDEIKESGIQVHQMGGWFDANATFQIAAANAWGGKMVIGPWGHGAAIRGTANGNNASGMDVNVEQLRWYDYVLKDMDNGYEDAPNFYYYVLNATKGEEWRYSDTFPLENSVNSVLYLAGKDSGEVIPDALKLEGEQSNNGKLSLVKPEGSSVDYQVDLTTVPEGLSNLDLSAVGEMQDAVDAKALTFTSAPLSSAAEIVGIPSVDLWISSDETNDVDFMAYLEEVKADGTSHLITQGAARASHRTTGENDLWDSTEGLAGRYHTSLTADVEAALEEGLEEPVLLQFNLEAIAYKAAAGSSLRLTVACANPSVYQHQMYYKTDANGEYILDEGGNYTMMEAAELPAITLYQGADKASVINVPVVENMSNTFNGTVTFDDGSYTGPGTMYLFENNWYLYADGDWTKLSVADGENAYTVQDNAAVFSEAGFSLLPEGSYVVKNGIAQTYQGGQANVQPFPTEYQLHVDTMANQVGNTNANMLLYLPVSKSLDINLFMPEDADEPVPVILYIHGFGGTNLDLDTNLLGLLDEGYALAGVDLRNYPPNENPLYYQDIKGNIRYLRANAEELGLDPDRIGIYGVSLGGNTSLMMLLSGNDEFLEGDVGGNLHVSSRVQAGIAGYAWSDAINFGADQRTDNDNNFELMKSMISGGDGENAPCAQAINFSGPGKGYLVLRNYLEARQAAQANDTLSTFLASDYTFTIDKAYVDQWFPGQEGSTNAYIGSGATVTLGTYTYTNAYMMKKVEDAEAASPAYYASPDDPVLVVFGGFGGRQNITNQQSVRTEAALQDNDVLSFYYGNSVVTWNDYTKYGNPAAVQAGFNAYWNNYLKEGPSGTKVVLTVGSDNAVVNHVDREIAGTLKIDGGQPKIPANVINKYLGTNLTGYLTVDEVKEATGATVTWYPEREMLVISSTNSLPEIPGGNGGNGGGSGGSTTQPTQPVLSDPSFADVPTDHWAADGINYVVENGIMNGTSATTFAPETNTTRAMVVTTLYRMSGSPAVTGTSVFSDVVPGAWYADAVIWATEAGVAKGYDTGAFGVDDLVTREQLATFLYRYAEGEVSATDLSVFVDAAVVSDWATDAVNWAVSVGILTGKPNSRLAPLDTATRAELAVILQRYLTQ